jgi:hypothetical protein
MLFCHKIQLAKAIFSGLTKFQKFARKIHPYSLTLESLHTVKKLAIAFTVYLPESAEGAKTPRAEKEQG